MNENMEMEKETQAQTEVSHLKVGSEGIVDTREQLLNSIESKDKTLTELAGPGGFEAAEETFKKLPTEKQQKLMDSIAAYQAKIKEVDWKISSMSDSDGFRQGTNEMFNLVRKAKVWFKERQLGKV
jgi:hypothetical protein